MKLVEVEGTHTLQTTLSSLDVHVGQSYSVLVTANQSPQDYYIAVSTRFTNKVLSATAILHYSNSAKPVSGLPPSAPTTVEWSLNQARAIRFFPYTEVHPVYPSTIFGICMHSVQHIQNLTKILGYWMEIA